MQAPTASATTPYIHSLAVTGVTAPPATPACATSAPGGRHGSSWNRPWLPASVIATGASLTYGLSAVPDAAWGSSPSAVPPSYAAGRLPAVGFTTPGGSVSVPAGQTMTVQLGVQPAEAGSSNIQWSARGTGLMTSPSDGAFTIHATAQPAPGGAAGCVLSAAGIAVHPGDRLHRSGALCARHRSQDHHRTGPAHGGARRQRDRLTVRPRTGASRATTPPSSPTR